MRVSHVKFFLLTPDSRVRLFVWKKKTTLGFHNTPGFILSTFVISAFPTRTIRFRRKTRMFVFPQFVVDGFHSSSASSAEFLLKFSAECRSWKNNWHEFIFHCVRNPLECISIDEMQRMCAIHNGMSAGLLPVYFLSLIRSRADRRSKTNRVLIRLNTAENHMPWNSN